MGAFTSLSGPAPQAQEGPYGGRASILVAFPDRAPQQRLSVLVRIILAIPHLIALEVLGFVAEIVVVIGWFGALFTGRLPRFAEDYLSGVLHWQVRVSAYCLLLTGAYPPFTLGDADYPVRLAVPPRGPLNRFAVFFRIILAIPAAILLGLLAYGALSIMLFITWLIVLVTGNMPAPLYQAYAAVLRFQTRWLGYLELLTSEYPKALFGDEPVPGEATTGTASLAARPGSYGAQPESYGTQPESYGTQPESYGAQPESYGAQPESYGAQPGTYSTQPGEPPAQPGAHPAQPGAYPAQPGEFTQPIGGPGSFRPPSASFAAEPGSFPARPGPPAYAGTFAPAIRQPWRLVLSRAARNLIGMFLAIGALLLVINVIFSTSVLGSANTIVIRNNAIHQVQSAYSVLSQVLSPFQAKYSACQGNVSCVTALDRQAGQAFDTFGTSVQGTAMPNGTSSSAADQLASASLQAGQLLLRLGHATTAAQYEAILTSTNVQQVLNQVDVDYQNLGTKLGAR